MKLPRPPFLLAGALAPIAVAADAGIAGSDLSFLAYLVSGVAGVIAAVAWIDHRIDKRAKSAEEVAERRSQAMEERLTGRLENLMQRLIDAGHLPAPSPSGSWPLHQHRRHGDEG